MKQKVMTVELCTVSADARTYYVAELMLPAQGHEIRDALQQVRFPEVSNTFHEISVLSCPVLPQLVGLRLDAPTVQELAYFANRVNDLPIDELIVLKGVFQRFVEDESLGEVVSMKDLINMTYGLENVMVAANVTNDTALGQFVIENGLHQNVADVPDESVFLLDKALIGKLQRESDQGIYVDGFYVVTCDYEIPEVYNGITLPEPPQDAETFGLTGLATTNLHVAHSDHKMLFGLYVFVVTVAFLIRPRTRNVIRFMVFVVVG